MLDGKMLRAPTGTPMRRMDFANSPFALAEPEPFTLANLTTKSFVAASGFGMMCSSASLPGQCDAAVRPPSGTPSIAGRGLQLKRLHRRLTDIWLNLNRRFRIGGMLHLRCVT